ncbi:MAG: sugar ABC transporter ATP-binding protein, partial [Verrucomicrobiota bacterium]
GLDLDPSTPVGELTIGHQQLVEIAKALSTNARILIMDEPTSSLSQREAERLFEVVRDLQAAGVAVLYISHRMAEVVALADRVVVLRDGEKAGELSGDEIDHDALVKLMVGRDLSQFYDHKPEPPGEVMLELSGLENNCWPGKPISLRLCKGEIVGLAGLVGSGRTELLETIFGVRRAEAGTLLVEGQNRQLGHPSDAIAAGIALVPEDRKQHGLVTDMSVAENASLASLKRDQRCGLTNRSKEQELVSTMVDQLKVKAASLAQMVRLLSGGNQQKVVLAKWLSMNPKVLLLDEPTRGIDIGAKQEIYQLMESLAAEGIAILFVSSEMEEIIGMSDRVLVMHEGEIAGELSRDELSEERIVALASGLG